MDSRKRDVGGVHDGGWTISTWSVSLPTLLGGRDRDDVVVVAMATDT